MRILPIICSQGVKFSLAQRGQKLISEGVKFLLTNAGEPENEE
jgi:hypothetical protein